MTASGPDRCLLLTPPGAGAIAVVRLTGPNANEILSRVFKPNTRRAPGGDRSSWVSYGQIIGFDRLVVDDVLVASAPSLGRPDHEVSSSFDITTHGGIRVVERTIKVLTQAGAYHCSASVPDVEVWTVVNEIEGESIHELCRVRTQRAARFLASQRRGLVDALDELAIICESNAGKAQDALQCLIDSHRAAQVLLHGARIALVGPPNSGKSTLFNHLAGHRAAVVSPRAGTTRDWVTASVEFDGVPIDLIDTAGVRAASGFLEQKAMESGQAVASACDLAIYVVDAACPPAQDDSAEFLPYGLRATPRITAINKIDLVERKTDQPKAWGSACPVSARTGAGISDLVNACLAHLGLNAFRDSAPSLFTDRQLAAACKALRYLDDAPEQAAELIGCELIGRKTA